MPLSTCDSLVLATTNPHKARELIALLAPLKISLLSLADFSNVQPVSEEADTLADNARRKATGYAKQLGRWILSDDTGLEVDALGGAPGVRSARFAGENATMAENRARLLTELAHVSDERRTARFVCRIAIADPTGAIVLEAEGDCRGTIRRDLAGTGGFGYDTLFEVAGTGQTLAELTTTETGRVGHRGRAVRALLDAFQAENP